ncbi:MAG: FAD-dependent oxidoreductase [Micromonosporaceae bacterium]
MEELPVIVIGAGPVGLAAAAHLAERDIDFVVLEAGASAGSALAEWRHVRLFSPWRYDIDAAARRLLEADGWVAPDPDELPTSGDLVAEYLQPLAKLPALADRIRYAARVTAIGRAGVDRVRSAGRDDAPYLVRLANGEELTARAVIDASGTWRTPNVLGGYGLPAHGEAHAVGAGVVVGPLPDVLGADRERFAGRRTAVVGAGHSAATTLLELAELAGASPVWVVRRADPGRSYGGGEADELPARGALGSRLRQLVRDGRVEVVTGFPVKRIELDSDGRAVLVSDEQRDTGEQRGNGERPGTGERRVTADVVVNATGFRPDHTVASELRLDLDPILGATRALAPLIDPNLHSCGTVPPHGVDELTHPDPGYYAVGVKSYGHAPTFLLTTGYEQVRSVVAALAGDWQAARQVELALPETGVCSSSLVYGEPEADDCCGTPAGTASDSTASDDTAPAGRGLATGLPALPVLESTRGGGCCG